LTESSLVERVAVLADGWGVRVDELRETPSSVIAFGGRASEHVVLKVVKRAGDEWRCGEVLSAFASMGVVRVHEYTEGAVLMERLSPGSSLIPIVVRGRETDATTILAKVIAEMSPHVPPAQCPTIEAWGRGFQWYRENGGGSIPISLLDAAEATYAEQCRTQRSPRLLHGDLQHSNILFDDARGWTAIDPKGVVGELAYEAGALFRNPHETPELLVDPSVIASRANVLHSMLGLDPTRVLRWSFAQAVLSAIWCIQDGEPALATTRSLAVAAAIQRILH